MRDRRSRYVCRLLLIGLDRGWSRTPGQELRGKASLHERVASRSKKQSNDCRKKKHHSHYSELVAPSTFPTMLYLLEKKVTQSASVPFSLSLRSFQSGLTSSTLVDDLPSALEASFPAKTSWT